MVVVVSRADFNPHDVAHDCVLVPMRVFRYDDVILGGTRVLRVMVHPMALGEATISVELFAAALLLTP